MEYMCDMPKINVFSPTDNSLIKGDIVFRLGSKHIIYYSLVAFFLRSEHNWEEVKSVSFNSWHRNVGNQHFGPSVSFTPRCIYVGAIMSMHIVASRFTRIITFFVWAFLLRVHTWNSSLLRSNDPAAMHLLYRSNNFSKASWKSSLKVSMTFVTTSFISSIISKRQPLSLGTLRNCFDAHLGQIVCDKDGVVDWCIVLVEMPLTRFEECWPFLNSLKVST